MRVIYDGARGRILNLGEGRVLTAGEPIEVPDELGEQLITRDDVTKVTTRKPRPAAKAEPEKEELADGS